MSTKQPFLEQVLYDNAIDFINKSMQSYLIAEDDNNPKEYKYAILFLATGTELILKSILQNKHPLFVLSNIDSMDDKTVGAEKLIPRINRIYAEDNIRIHNKDAEIFKSIREVRNSIMHKDVRLDVAPNTMYARTLYSLDRIVQQFLNKTLHNQVDNWSLIVDSEAIRKEYYSKVIGYKLGDSHLPCSVCSLEKLLVDQDNPQGLKCFHCNQKYSTVVDAIKSIEDSYLQEELFVSYLHILRSNQVPVDTCPNCGTPDYLQFDSDSNCLICFDCGVIPSSECIKCEKNSAFTYYDEDDNQSSYCVCCKDNPLHGCDLCTTDEYDSAGIYNIDIRDLATFKRHFNDVALKGVFPQIEICENCLKVMYELEKKMIIEFVNP
ncbi:hypothetical protein [Priestia megaterium]|uniref:hypothetical protein n=1 Tax=Priestia megaterium TaxID=1404 RepID=UPI00099071CE|nr:hypothetical protein [Priestia megaterium]AQU73780.1 hypothetical protein BUW91_10915 [Priestia megaterium]